MTSEKFMLNSDAGRMAAARYATEDFARQADLTKRDTLRLDLLVEETLGMVKVMVDEFYGQLWFVGNGNACEIHLEATATMNANRKQELLSVSSSGRNAAAKGFMSMLGEMISAALYGFGHALDTYGMETMKYGVVHAEGIHTPGNPDLMPLWTLQSFKVNLDSADHGDAAVEAACDELEKSIVANLADDIVVGVKGDRIELVITKRFGA